MLFSDLALIDLPLNEGDEVALPALKKCSPSPSTTAELEAAIRRVLVHGG